MTDPEGRRRPGSLFESLREIYLERRTGVLRIPDADGEQRLFFVGGDFYLEPDHRVAIAAYRWLTSGARSAASEGGGGSGAEGAADDTPEARPRPSAGSGTREWAPELIEGLLSVDEEGFEFEEGAARIPLDLVGPLPTGNLVMELAVAERDESQLLRVLGGEEQRYVAEADSEGSEGLPDLDPLDAFFLSRLEQASPVRELLGLADENRETALRSLCRLKAVRLILPEDLVPARRPWELVSAELLEKFQQRIGDDLAANPLKIDTEAHRLRVVELLGGLGEVNFYQLLSVGLGCSAEELHLAYTELARVVHPEHAEALGLKGKEEALAVLFERTTEAYLTLSDPERSGRYQLSLGDSLVGVEAETDGAKRKEEEKEIAAHNYRAAKNRALQNDYFSAIQLLEQAVRGDALPEYYALLGQCQAENPRWIDKAIYNCSR
ncbi:MAG: J domain-containing protein, partial [Thermoanaerobaculia bacterium]